MERRSSLIFAIALFIFFVILLISTINYPTKAKIFPLIVISISLILLGVRILPQEVLTLKQKGEVVEATEASALRRRYLVVGIWLTLTLAMLWIFGFLATVILLPFLYLRRHGERWLLCISLPFGSGVFFYVLFALILKMPLYKGLLFLTIFS